MPSARKGRRPKLLHRQDCRTKPASIAALSRPAPSPAPAPTPALLSGGEAMALIAAAMPPLAGKRLEPPLFHTTNWRPWQTFRESDDPDRMRLPWQPPSFVQATDAATLRAETTAEELHVPDGSFARIVHGVLTEKQCAELLSQVNKKGFTPALLNIGRGLQQLRPQVRDGHHIIVDSPELAAWLFEALRPHLPSQMGKLHLVGVNERLRVLCYTPGQAFEQHCDSCYVRPAEHLQAGDTSMVTVQLYLHDVPLANGGATTFFPGCHDEVAQQPEAGSVLLFTQDLPHEGSLVKAGLKYTVRTEVMYSAMAPPALDIPDHRL